MKIQLINREGEVERTQQLREVESILPSRDKALRVRSVAVLMKLDRQLSVWLLTWRAEHSLAARVEIRGVQ